MLVSVTITVILTLIAIGSEVAYGILLSLNVSGLLTSYIICVACALYRRNAPGGLPPSRFSLGKFGGNLINTVSLCFMVVFFVFQFFPSVPNPGAAGMNWAAVIYVAVAVLFSVYYFVRANKRYVGPVVNVQKEA